MGNIVDSGVRREFETGAVRDIQEGKGRFDLMPLDVVGAILEANCGDDVGYLIESIYFFTVDDDVLHLYNAINAFCKFSCTRSYDAMLEVAKHFEDGAKKYGEFNWQKGIPTHCYIDSAMRHLMKYLRGDEDEHHDRAFIWNIMCCIWTAEHKPEIDDYREDGE